MSTGPLLSAYTLVHLVAGETTKDLVIPQVVLHMVEQAKVDGPLRPSRVVVVFLEPARIAAQRAVRERVAQIRKLAPSVRVALIPYVSRFGLKANAHVTARLIRRLAGSGDVVFHCRGEWAVLWAAELAGYFDHAGIVADVRGAWPEEALAKRGFSGPENADAQGVRDFHLQLAIVQEALARAGEILTVSSGMRDWLERLGVTPGRLHYVPSCVPRLTYSHAVRVDQRRELGVGDELLYCFLGSAESYATIGDGLAPFLRATFDAFDDVRLLMVTDRPKDMRSILDASGIAESRALIVGAPHDQVWRYLCAADCGCILKQRGRLNRTWQPVKLGEYLAAGLPVVVSCGIGRVDDMITASGAGLAVDLFDGDDADLASEAVRVHDALRNDATRMRERALQLCSDEFLWSRYVDRVRHAYSRALDAS
jgi:glycosyltransferase involved in cell wall biosynthesis